MAPRPPRPRHPHPSVLVAPCAAVALLAPLLAGCAGIAGDARSFAPTAAASAASSAVAPDSALAGATFDSVWAIVGRTHHDPTMRGVDWPAARAELRPAAVRARTTAELRAAIDALLARLGESHLQLVPREALDGGAASDEPGDVGSDEAIDAAIDAAAAPTAPAEPGDVGLALRVVDGELAVVRVDADGPAARAGVRAGWTVRGIDGWSAAPSLHAVGAAPEREARRALALHAARAAELRLDGVAGDTVRVALADARGRATSVRLVRRATPGTVVRFGALPPQVAHLAHERRAVRDGCVGVVRFNVWMTAVLPELGRAMRALDDCAGIVVDLRGNPGGVAGMIAGVGGWFLDSAATLGTMRARGATLRLAAVPRRVTDDGEPAHPFAGRLAIVVDAHTASTSEFLAGGLQALGRARVFGDTTSGMALPAGMARLPNGDALLHALADYVDAGGRRLEGRGVAPDVVVPLTLAALRTGRDLPLDAAVAWAARP